MYDKAQIRAIHIPTVRPEAVNVRKLETPEMPGTRGLCHGFL